MYASRGRGGGRVGRGGGGMGGRGRAPPSPGGASPRVSSQAAFASSAQRSRDYHVAATVRDGELVHGMRPGVSRLGVGSARGGPRGGGTAGGAGSMRGRGGSLGGASYRSQARLFEAGAQARDAKLRELEFLQQQLAEAERRRALRMYEPMRELRELEGYAQDLKLRILTNSTDDEHSITQGATPWAREDTTLERETARMVRETALHAPAAQVERRVCEVGQELRSELAAVGQWEAPVNRAVEGSFWTRPPQ